MTAVAFSPVPNGPHTAPRQNGIDQTGIGQTDLGRTGLPRRSEPAGPSREPSRPGLPRRRRSWAVRVAAVVGAAGAAGLAGVLVVCLALRWIEPPTTMFMRNDPYVVTYEYVPLSDMSPALVAAAIVHEDPSQAQRLDWPVIDHEREQVLARYDRPASPGFLDRHGGTDWQRLWVRATMTRRTGQDVGGSTTIEQQTVKNLFLTKSKTAWRKAAVEPVLAEVYGLVVPRERKIEIYLNVAEFGPGIFGVCAASWYYFNKPPVLMSEAEAVDLVAVMPMPKQFRASKYGGVLPLKVEPGSKYAPRRLLDYTRRNVPGQIVHDRVYEHMQRLAIQPGQQPTGSCARMPAGVVRTLNVGLQYQDARS